MLRALFIGCIFLYVINFFAFDYLKLRYNAIVYAIFACPLLLAGKWSAEALVTSCVIMGGIFSAISSVFFGVCYRFLDGVIKNMNVADSKLKY